MANKLNLGYKAYYARIPALDLINLLDGPLAIASVRLGVEGNNVHEAFMRLLAAAISDNGVFAGTDGMTAVELMTSKMGLNREPALAMRIIDALVGVDILEAAQDGSDEYLFVPLISWLGKPATSDSRRHTKGEDKRLADNISLLPDARYHSVIAKMEELKARGA